MSPLGDETNFDLLNPPVICFLLLVPKYKRVQNNTTKMHENPPFDIKKRQKAEPFKLVC